jgi:hypothetical protein
MYVAWSAEEVASEITNIGLGKYSRLFVEQEIDGSVLHCLCDGDLKEMGLTIGARVTVLQWISALPDTHYMPPEDGTGDYPEPDEATSLDLTALSRTRCPTCHRNFNVDRISRHAAVCGRLAGRRPFDSQKMRTRELKQVVPPESPATEPAEVPRPVKRPMKKRPIWDARAKRLEGTGAEEFFKDEEPVKPNRDFRKGHAALHQVIHTARRVTKLKRILESR